MDANTTNELRGELAEKNITMYRGEKLVGSAGHRGDVVGARIRGFQRINWRFASEREDFVSLVKEDGSPG